MAILTKAAAIALVVQQQCVVPVPGVPEIIVGTALHEGAGTIDTLAIHDNSPGGRSYYPKTVQEAIVTVQALQAIGHLSLDLGAGQINTTNLGWISRTLWHTEGRQTLMAAFDPCLNFAASQAVMWVRYNGLPPNAGPEDDARKAAYFSGITARVRSLAGVPSPPPIQVHTVSVPSHALRDALHDTGSGLTDLLHPAKTTSTSEKESQ